MGDHRVSLKITVEMYDKKKKCDAWINYSKNIGEEYGEWIQETIEKLKLDEWIKQSEELK